MSLGYPLTFLFEKRDLLTSVLNAIVNNPFKENYDTIMGNIKSYPNNNCFFFSPKDGTIFLLKKKKKTIGSCVSSQKAPFFFHL